MYTVDVHSLMYSLVLLKLFSVSDASLAGNGSVSVEHSLCSFYGWFTDSRTASQETITPAQCYMDQPNDSES